MPRWDKSCPNGALHTSAERTKDRKLRLKLRTHPPASGISRLIWHWHRRDVPQEPRVAAKRPPPEQVLSKTHPEGTPETVGPSRFFFAAVFAAQTVLQANGSTTSTDHPQCLMAMEPWRWNHGKRVEVKEKKRLAFLRAAQRTRQQPTFALFCTIIGCVSLTFVFGMGTGVSSRT